MDTQNDHTHMEIKTRIKNGQSESGCVPWQRAIMRYKKYEVSAQLMNIKYGSYAFTEQNMKSPMIHIALHSKLIFIFNKTSLMLDPHQIPFYFCMNQFRKFHHLESQNLIHAYFKTLKKKKSRNVKIACQKEKWQQN